MVRLNIPITKVEVPRRLVFAVAQTEVPDRGGEICDYRESKPLYLKWAERRTTVSILGAMNGKVIAGYIIRLTFDDDAKTIKIMAVIHDDGEWSKILNGVYTGFIQGGLYARRWTEDDRSIRYTVDPRDFSLADLPCDADARFEVVDRNGHTWRPFKRWAGQSSIEFAALRAANLARNIEWSDGRTLSLSFRGNELAGEVGEACNILKKLDREQMGIAGSRATIAQAAEELADVVICADLAAMALGIDLGSAIVAKFDATSAKNGLKTRMGPAAHPDHAAAP